LLRCLEYIRQFSLLTKHQSDSQIAKKILDEARQALEEPDKTNIIVNVIRIQQAASIIEKVNNHITETVDPIESDFFGVQQLFAAVSIEPEKADDLLQKWSTFRKNSLKWLDPQAPALADSTEKQNLHQQASAMVRKIDDLLGIGSGISGSTLLEQVAKYRIAVAAAENVRRPLDHKKYLDMLIDDAEATCIDLIEGTRAQTSNIDNYLQRLGLALEDDFNKQFYQPAFRRAPSMMSASARSKPPASSPTTGHSQKSVHRPRWSLTCPNEISSSMKLPTPHWLLTTTTVPCSVIPTLLPS
jgi:hypothetical protein